jgi:DNA repair protein RadC
MNGLSKISDDVIKNEYKQRFRIHDGGTIKSSKGAAEHLETFFGKRYDRERFVVIFLNGRNQILLTEVLFEGTLTSSAVYPREIIKEILHLGAASIIVAHNHPSGNKNPSKDDVTITKKIKEACKTIDVELHDHLILVPGGEFTSLSDKGLL